MTTLLCKTVMKSHLPGFSFPHGDNIHNRNRIWLTGSFSQGSVSCHSKPRQPADSPKLSIHILSPASMCLHFYWPPAWEWRKQLQRAQKKWLRLSSAIKWLYGHQSRGNSAALNHRGVLRGSATNTLLRPDTRPKTNVERNPSGSFNHRTEGYCTRGVGH